MKYYGTPKIEKIEHRLCEYIRCDICNSKIIDKETFFQITSGQRKLRFSSCDSVRRLDICEKCLDKYVGDYFKDRKTYYTAYIQVNPNIFVKNSNYFGEYNEYDDCLIENDEFKKTIKEE